MSSVKPRTLEQIVNVADIFCTALREEFEHQQHDAMSRLDTNRLTLETVPVYRKLDRCSPFRDLEQLSDLFVMRP
jgi:hypothetical protein